MATKQFWKRELLPTKPAETATCALKVRLPKVFLASVPGMVKVRVWLGALPETTGVMAEPLYLAFQPAAGICIFIRLSVTTMLLAVPWLLLLLLQRFKEKVAVSPRIKAVPLGRALVPLLQAVGTGEIAVPFLAVMSLSELLRLAAPETVTVVPAEFEPPGPVQVME